MTAARRRFTQEFTAELCREVINTSKPIKDVATAYGVGAESLRSWFNKYHEANGGTEADLTVSERARLKELEREVQELRAETAFLKKPALSSRESSGSEHVRVHRLPKIGPRQPEFGRENVPLAGRLHVRFLPWRCEPPSGKGCARNYGHTHGRKGCGRILWWLPNNERYARECGRCGWRIPEVEIVSKPFEMRTRTMVRGPSMWRLYMAALALGGVAAIVSVGALFVLVRTQDSPRVVPLVLVIFVAFIASFLVAHWASKQKDRECAAGYTTSGLGYPNLEQVDQATGLIVRSAGEPLLTRQERLTRVRAFKATLAES